MAGGERGEGGEKSILLTKESRIRKFRLTLLSPRSLSLSLAAAAARRTRHAAASPPQPRTGTCTASTYVLCTYYILLSAKPYDTPRREWCRVASRSPVATTYGTRSTRSRLRVYTSAAIASRPRVLRPTRHDVCASRRIPFRYSVIPSFRHSVVSVKNSNF